MDYKQLNELRLSCENRKTSTSKREKHNGRVYFYQIVYMHAFSTVYANQLNMEITQPT
jgi:hypothetical protein